MQNSLPFESILNLIRTGCRVLRSMALPVRIRTATVIGRMLLLLAVGLLSQRADAQNERPNILLIVADDLGFSDLGCYGGEIDTPNLNRLANDGVRLTQFYTTGRCCPSRASILTGLYPHAVGLGHMTKDIGRPGYRGQVSADVPVLAERLEQRGYRCYLSGKWHLGTDNPTERGFEEFYGTLVSAKTFWDPDHFLRMSRAAPSSGKGDQPGRKDAPGQDDFYGTDALADHAIQFLQQSRSQSEAPWFLYLAFNAPHFPLHAPAETIAKYADRYHGGWDQLRKERLQRMKKLGLVDQETRLTPRSPFYDWAATEPDENPAWASLPVDRRNDLARRMAIYAAMVDRMDQNIGRVLSDLDRQGEVDNTLIIFTSDNGACAEWDAFGFDIKSGPQNILHRGDQIDRMGSKGTYHSVGSGWANASNTPWRLYKHFNHEGGIAVPCILHWPAATEEAAGTIDDSPTHLIDLVPTALSAAGTPSTGSTTTRSEFNAASDLLGRSLLPLLQGKGIAAAPLYFEHEGNRAVRDGRWKLVALRNQPWELYDMQVDRLELNDLAADRPALVRRLAAMWEQWAAANHVTPLPTDYEVEYLPSQ